MPTVGVVGAGTMGLGIVEVALLGGFEVILHDLPDPLATAALRLRKALERAQARREDVSALDQLLDRLRTTCAMEDLARFDLVIEAVPEDLELKRNVFSALQRACGEDAVLASNTSSIPITTIAATIEDPERVVGMHFFNPVARMQLVEVISALQSDAHAVQVARDAAEQMGKTVIVAPDVPGFSGESLRASVHHGGAAPTRRAHRRDRADRPHLPHGRRVSHGAVRADGPRRD
jgi:3-hydroxyacyl-CoA dehydrogenase